MKHGLYKASDIRTVDFLEAIIQALYGRPHFQTWAMRWNVEHILRFTYPACPDKVIMAKFRRLKDQGVVDGCSCGCRGDWEILTPWAVKAPSLDEIYLPDLASVSTI